MFEWIFAFLFLFFIYNDFYIYNDDDEWLLLVGNVKAREQKWIKNCKHFNWNSLNEEIKIN